MVPTMVVPLIKMTVTDWGCSFGVSTPSEDAEAPAGRAGVGTPGGAGVASLGAAAGRSTGAGVGIPFGGTGGSSASVKRESTTRNNPIQLAVALQSFISSSP